MPEPLILVHGGAGNVPAASRERHRAGCARAASAGGGVLAAGGTAVEAVCSAVAALEDDDLYNAGTGCALDASGKVALDAAVMCGATGAAGAVALLPPFRNPIRVAQRVLPEPEILLGGEEAALWAEAQGFERLAEDALVVERSRKAWEWVVERGGASNWAGGTVGAVARDSAGRLAAATSTGGKMGKLPGRIGDSPIVGAGTWADERCAISGTGEGEAFLSAVFCARLADDLGRDSDPEAALRARLVELRDRYAGTGGAILLTATGGPFAWRTTPGMSHAWWSPSASGSAD